MTWFKVDDHLHSHKKSMRAGTEAMGLWVLAGSWSAAEESDGWVPDYVLGRLVGPNGDELAEQLVRAGMWEADVHDGEDGYRFHAWEEYQPTAEQLEAKRAATRERVRAVRARGAEQRTNTAGSTRVPTQPVAPDVTPTPTRPDPTRKTTGGKPPASDPEHFGAFWQQYPRKEGRKAAVKAWEKAARDTDPATILAGLENATQVWSATGTERRFIPHPTTWLNRGSWADEQPLPDMPEHKRDQAAGVQAGYDLPPLPDAPPEVLEAGGKAWTEWARATRAEQRAELERKATA